MRDWRRRRRTHFFFFFFEIEVFSPTALSFLSSPPREERKEEEHAEHAARGEAQRESKRSANAREKKLKNQDGRASKKGKKKRTTKFTLDLCPFRQGRCGASWWASRLSFYQIDHDAASDSCFSRSCSNLPAFSLSSATREEEARWSQRRERSEFLSNETAGITRNAAAVAAGVDRLFFFFFACCCTPPGDSEEAPCLSPPPQRRRQIRSHLPGCGFARGTPLPVS